MSHEHQPQRRALLAAAAALAFAPAVDAQTAPVIEVWKSPTCGCCNDWIKHLQANGFTVKSNGSGNTAKRSQLGLPSKYASCHTGVVAGYVVEGHVPAADIKRLLAEKPQALGLAVPEMPIGSPGMDGPAYGNRVEPYDVLLVARDGSAKVFASYGKERK